MGCKGIEEEKTTAILLSNFIICLTAEAAGEPAANGASSQEMQAKGEKETSDEMTKGPQEEAKVETAQVCTSSILDPDSLMSVVSVQLLRESSTWF